MAQVHYFSFFLLIGDYTEYFRYFYRLVSYSRDADCCLLQMTMINGRLEKINKTIKNETNRSTCVAVAALALPLIAGPEQSVLVLWSSR